MALLSFLFNTKPKSASAAKERLQIIIARERTNRSGPDFLPALHQELIAVISKSTKVNADDIKISLDRQGNLEVLDVNVVLPDAVVELVKKLPRTWRGIAASPAGMPRPRRCIAGIFQARREGLPRKIRAGSNNMAVSSANTAPTLIPTSRNGNASSHTSGYKISASSASGQHRHSKISHSKKLIITFSRRCRKGTVMHRTASNFDQ